MLMMQKPFRMGPNREAHPSVRGLAYHHTTGQNIP
jgi:hypothetical protein